MKCKFINVLMFAAGAAVGSAVTWKVMKDKYEQIVQEEIASIKAVFSNQNESENDDSEEDYTDDEDEDQGHVEPYRQIDWSELEDLDEEEDEPDQKYVPNRFDLEEYAEIVDNYTREKGGAETVTKNPYVIAPYDYGELDDYKQVELTYYLDNILEDDSYHIITNADELIGPQALTTFGEYEDDAVFVRNEALQTDFQILKDYRTYDEARRVSPYQVDDE